MGKFDATDDLMTWLNTLEDRNVPKKIVYSWAMDWRPREPDRYALIGLRNNRLASIAYDTNPIAKALRALPGILAFLLRCWRCERCGIWKGVALESSCTMYAYDGRHNVYSDPNRDIGLCRGCAEDHHAYWDSMWADYNSGRL